MDNLLQPDQLGELPEAFICFSHLRWDFVYQRPQHLLSRLSVDTIVYYIEEPVADAEQAHYAFHYKSDNLVVVVPHLPFNISTEEETKLQRMLLDKLIMRMDKAQIGFWYYTPMALRFSRHIRPQTIVFDCMDELSAFRFAPQELKELEQELLDKADVVFTGGASLYAAKKDRHPNIHLLPSSIDKAHFAAARQPQQCPDDHLGIPHPRLGFFGVIDERFDPELILTIADQRPGWNIVMIGPIVKIDPLTLPRRANIHYLGSKPYSELPAYLAGWDVALIPFALNEATRFISPTKTPEYLAAGVPVISTPLTDVVEPYGRLSLVSIAATAEEFILAVEQLLHAGDNRQEWSKRVDAFLRNISWDDTYRQVKQCIIETTLKTEQSLPVEAVAATAVR